MGLLKRFRTFNIALHFNVQYNGAIEQGKNELDALSVAVNFYRHREPFHNLTEFEVKNFVNTIYNEPKLNKNIELIKELIIKVMTECETRMDVAVMRKFIKIKVDKGDIELNQILKKIGWEIYDLLEKYVAIHDELNSKSNSALSILKPIDFDQLSKSLKTVEGLLNQKKQELKNIDYDILSELQGGFAACLRMYIDALLHTISLFIKMVDELEARATNQGNLTLKEHLVNNKSYKYSIEKYQGIGDELAKLYKLL